MRIIINTVGTSLKRNAQRVGEPDLVAFLMRTAPKEASAEANGLSHLLHAGDTLRFLHSSTAEGLECAEALVAYFRRSGFAAEGKEITGLTYSEHQFRDRGLRRLVSLLCEEIRQARKRGLTPILHATGGFKAEAVYAGLVGQLLGVEVYYIHEEFRDLICLPATPLGWDMGMLLWHEEFFHWIAEDMRLASDVNNRLAALVDEEEEGFRMLSPLGIAYYEAFIGSLERAEGVRVELSAQAQATWESYDSSTRERFRRWLERVKEPGLRRSQSERLPTSDAVIFPQGHCDERLFFYEGPEGQVRILELALHEGGSYEKLCRKGVRRKDYTTFLAYPTS